MRGRPMVHNDASSQAHLHLAAPIDPAPRQKAAPRTPSPQGPLRTNLPVPITSFVGRAGELAAVQRWLAASRLVTLIGAGGVGKTRLALRVAEEALEDYPDGVWLAQLAPLADPMLVPSVVAAALGVREQAGVPIVQSLKQALRPRRMLLLLDTCEHLAQACAELAEDLLGACPDVQILATSREPLGTNGEVVWRVPSLEVPDPRAAAKPEQMTAYAATRLFIERATAARPDFRVTEQNAAAIGEVCRRLDGIPLALELAATRLRVLSVERIAARLDDRFRLLTGGSRTAPSRQQTLRATLDWSYALLQDPERRLFNRLSVFAGSWTLEAAEAICAGAGIEPGDVLDRLGHLVDHSLVVADEQAGQVRYRLLDSMRQYAAETLEASGESAELRGRHRDWFLAQAERSPFDLFDPSHLAWLAEELDNLRVALRWSIQRGEVDAGLRLAKAAGALWYQRGSYAEGRAWFAELLALDSEAATPARAFALAWASRLAMMQSDFTVARALAGAGLALARRLGDTWVMAGALLEEGGIAVRLGDLARARSSFEEGLSVSRVHAHEALEFYLLLNLATLYVEQGDHAQAEVFAAESLALARRLGHVWGAASSLYDLGRAAVGRGDHAAGRSLLEQSLALYREHADFSGIGIALTALAHVSLDQGELSRAMTLLAESLTLAKESGDRLQLAHSLEGLVGVWVELHPDRAVRLAGTATALRESLATVGYPWERERLDRWLTAAQRSLGQRAYETAWSEGRTMPLERAVELAGAQDGPDGAARAPRVADHPAHRLSPREREVVRLVARGCTNRQIAEQLVIAPRTADTHIGHILAKLNLHSRAGLAAWAVEHGLTAGRPV